MIGIRFGRPCWRSLSGQLRLPPQRRSSLSHTRKPRRPSASLCGRIDRVHADPVALIIERQIFRQSVDRVLGRIVGRIPFQTCHAGDRRVVDDHAALSLFDEPAKLMFAAEKDSIKVVGESIFHIFPGQEMDGIRLSHDAGVIHGDIDTTVSLDAF